MDLSAYGEDGVRVIFGDTIDLEVHKAVRRHFFFFKSLDIPGVMDIIPSFRSCLIRFDPQRTSCQSIMAIIGERAGAIGQVPVPEPDHVEIPVRYGGEYGPDMDFVASYSGLTVEEIVEIHTATVYHVFAVGFMPGFPYLGTLDRRLYVPRLETPRLKVSEGSVGLAQLQTGVYTFESPGGWRIIGKTEMSLFDARKAPYSLLKIGDTVRFRAL
jgi:KipI family sensor histidine kinase inhibitor